MESKKDSYWSLWGFMKTYSRSFKLPKRGLNCYFSDGKIFVGSKIIFKAIKNDFHAVQFLKKLDTDDEYYFSLIGEPND